MTARPFWAALLLHVLAVGFARPVAAEGKVPAVVLIWRGGTTPDEGKAALARLEAQVKDGNGLRFQVECASSTCTSFGYTRYWARFTVDPDGRIVVKDGAKELSKAECDD